MAVTKNHAARLRRVYRYLDRVLDALHAAQGELYPHELKGYRAAITGLLDGVAELRDSIVASVPPAAGGRPRASVQTHDEAA